MIFPVPLPDETLCSLLARVCRWNGIADFRDITTLYFGNPLYASFIDAHINLPEFCKRTDYAYGDSRAVLEQLTWLGAQVRLGEANASILVGMADGTLMPSLSKLTFHDAAALSYCPTCRLQDISEFGSAYWHRIHQLPVIRFCPQHGDRIVTVSVKRAGLHQAFPLPGDFELHRCPIAQRGVEVPAQWEGGASMVREVFASSAFFDAEIIDAAIWDELRVRRLVTPGGLLRKAEVVDLFFAHFFENRTTELTSEAVKFSERIVRSLMDPGRGVALGRAMLLHWLFGKWKAFEEKCYWIGVFGAGSKPATRKVHVSADKLELGLHHRTVCLGYMHERPGCSRLDFTDRAMM